MRPVAKILLLAALLAACASATGQPFPARAVRVIVPYPPGGGADFVTRVFCKALSDLQNTRVTKSAPPPGGYGTITRTARAGNGWPVAAAQAASNAASSSIFATGLMAAAAADLSAREIPPRVFRRTP